MADNINFGHVDWAQARLEFQGGKPDTIAGLAAAGRRRPSFLTPPPPAAPRINGPRVFGVRPGHPFLFTIAATGQRPMTFAADDLPPGLTPGPRHGTSSPARLKTAGRYAVTLHAQNAPGRMPAQPADHRRPDRSR